MVFSSLTFLCIFLPAVFVLYQILPGRRGKNALLIIASLIFYAYGESSRVILMILCSLGNWLFGLLVEKSASHAAKKFWFVLAFAADLTFLGVFKYADMAVQSINFLTGAGIPEPGIALPIGISFFTFQAMGYVGDVYRGKVKASRSFFHVLLYISFFPQLIAGPIVRYRDIAEEIENRSASAEDMAEGLRRMIYGLAKKVLLANTLGQMTDFIYAQDAALLSMPLAWLGAFGYILQLYFDFSGYSDMAIGMGRMFGFHFLENFNYPYASGSICDFWRRWHISLTAWFRENLYIPLGGNRKGKTRTWINRYVVFFFTGLWHGASWTFVLWGLYHGLLVTIETIFPRMTKKMGWFAHVYVILTVTLGFVLFRSESLAQAGAFFSCMFVPVTLSAQRLSVLGQAADASRIAAMAAGCAAALPVKNAFVNSGWYKKHQETAEYASYTGAFVLLLLCLLSLSGSAYNPFIYFRF